MNKLILVLILAFNTAGVIAAADNTSDKPVPKVIDSQTSGFS